MKPIGPTANAVVVNLGARRNLMQQLKGTVAILDDKERAERQKLIKELQLEQGKAKVTDGLRMIVLSAGPEAAIAHLRGELAVIDPGTEF